MRPQSLYTAAKCNWQVILTLIFSNNHLTLSVFVAIFWQLCTSTKPQQAILPYFWFLIFFGKHFLFPTYIRMCTCISLYAIRNIRLGHFSLHPLQFAARTLVTATQLHVFLLCSSSSGLLLPFGLHFTSVMQCSSLCFPKIMSNPTCLLDIHNKWASTVNGLNYFWFLIRCCSLPVFSWLWSVVGLSWQKSSSYPQKTRWTNRSVVDLL